MGPGRVISLLVRFSIEFNWDWWGTPFNSHSVCALRCIYIHVERRKTVAPPRRRLHNQYIFRFWCAFEVLLISLTAELISKTHFQLKSYSTILTADFPPGTTKSSCAVRLGRRRMSTVWTRRAQARRMLWICWRVRDLASRILIILCHRVGWVGSMSHQKESCWIILW